MITVLGSINLDLIATGENLPKPGETLTGKSFATASGGKGANQALAALRAGGEMKMVGAVGNDAFTAQALAELKAEGADLSGVQTRGDTTGIAVILVGGQGENVIVVVPGANGLVDEKMAQAALDEMRSGDILLLQQEIPVATLQAALDGARAKGIRTLLNTAPFSADSAALAKKADIVIANEGEFAGLVGRELAGSQLQQAMAERAQQSGQTLVVTLGGAGALAATPDGDSFAVPAPKIEPVDTVGAGDTFCGYLAAGLDAGLRLEAAMGRAVRAASLACLKPGAQPAIPNAADVEAFTL